MTSKRRFKLKVQLPKGFKILIQESKQWLPKGVLCLSNGEKRLYVKVCKQENILKGEVFEILSPEECKALNIEETVANEEYYNFERLIEE